LSNKANSNELTNYITGNDFDSYTGEVETKLADKLDASAYTATDLTDYYTKTEINGALSSKANSSDLTSYMLASDMTNFSGDVYTELSNKLDASAYTAVDTSNYYTKNEIDNKNFVTTTQTLTLHYSKSDVDNLLDDKVDTSAFTEFSGDVETALDDKVSQSDLSAFSAATYIKIGTKLDASAYTPSQSADLSNYYTKTEIDNKGYVSYATASLINYYTTSQTYSKNEVNNLIANSGGGGSNDNSVGIQPLNYAEKSFGHYNYSSIVNASDRYWNNGSYDSNLNVTGETDTLNNHAELFTIGNGKDSGNTHNALTIYRDGSVCIADINKIGKTYQKTVYNNDGQTQVETTYSYYDVPMINLQNKFEEIDNSFTNLNNIKTTSAQVSSIVDGKLAEFQESGGQVQPDWGYNDNSSAFNYIKNKPVGYFKVTLVKELSATTISKSNYDNNSYYYTDSWLSSSGHYVDNQYITEYTYPSEIKEYMLTDGNGELLSEAPSWFNNNTRYIIDVDGKRVLCNSANESNNGIRGNFTAQGGVRKYTCTLDASGNTLSEPVDVYTVYANYPVWLTQSNNYSSIKIYRVDETSNTSMYLTWYDINHVYFYDKEEINKMLGAPDWNDSYAIKNKPFGTYKVNKIYDAKPSSSSWYKPNSVIYELNDGRLYTSSRTSFYNLELHIGKLYFVYFNDEFYGTISPIQGSYGTQWITDNYDTSNYRPYLDYTGTNRIFADGYDYGNGNGYTNIGLIYDETHEMSNNNGATWYPKVTIYETNDSGSTTVVTQLESQYINLNDVVKDRNNLNKPFGDIVTETTELNITKDLFSSSALTTVQTGPSHYGSGVTFTTDWAVGDMVTLEVDGVNRGTAEVISANSRTEVGVGNTVNDTYKDNWLIYQGEGAYVLCITGASGSHSIHVYVGSATTSKVDSIIQLDTKYVNYDFAENQTIVNKPFGTYSGDTITYPIDGAFGFSGDTIYSYVNDVYSDSLVCSYVTIDGSNVNCELNIGDSFELIDNGFNKGYYSVTEPIYNYLMIGTTKYYLDKSIGDLKQTPYFSLFHANTVSTPNSNYEFESATCDTWLIVSTYRYNNNRTVKLVKHSPYTVNLKLDNKYLNLSNYYTKSEVDTAISNVSGGGGSSADLTNYYTKTEIDTMIGDIDTLLDNI
jgi:hypothetical protein